ncbi:hypothetical protein [Natrinema halophilum]|uniref:Uncharacterized protein n=1 Tax=Natrinema halophilum TaxID=1699371 RepID=A0A7D5KDX6_9EURY|nr:hypothetical protein [Natrinema halophilum]QLG49781.1 hypothetical protein HYG82_13385 [Natrinema halophilum]
MSTDSNVTEVFETVEADPDAILEAYDVESPAELVESGGDHEATTDPAIDADDETAGTLFASLQAMAVDAAEASAGSDGNGRPDSTPTITQSSESDSGSADAARVAEQAVYTASETDDSPANVMASAPDSDGTLTLLGPEPTTTRVSNDAFGLADSAGDPSEFQWSDPEPAETRR